LSPLVDHGLRRRSLQNWRVRVPVLTLIAVAVVQVILTRTAGLSPWKGGGFGMFATTDGVAFRQVRIIVDAPGRSEQLAVTPSLQTVADRAALMPSDRLLTQLAQAVEARERRRGRPVATIRIEISRVEFEGDVLTGSERHLRTFDYNVP
jgi:hypothetical protein